MSVYIKGMKMPRSCDECYIRKKDSCPILKANLTGWGRRIDCPLIEVPDHGDLIDRDELFNNSDSWLWWDEWGSAKAALDNAPIVIPAERSEDEAD